MTAKGPRLARRVTAICYGGFLTSSAVAAVTIIVVIWAESTSEVVYKILGTAMALTVFFFVVLVGTRALEARNWIEGGKSLERGHEARSSR